MRSIMGAGVSDIGRPVELRPYGDVDAYAAGYWTDALSAAVKAEREAFEEVLTVINAQIAEHSQNFSPSFTKTPYIQNCSRDLGVKDTDLARPLEINRHSQKASSRNYQAATNYLDKCRQETDRMAENASLAGVEQDVIAGLLGDDPPAPTIH